MIEVFSWPTPNGHKVHIMLEECDLGYKVIPVNIGAGDQFKPEFLNISPNNKIPAMIDPYGPDGEPIALFESGAILFYLARKTGKFLPAADREAYEVLQWVMFQMSSVGPMFGQAYYFRHAQEKSDHAADRFSKEARRICGVAERRLAQSPWLGGETYTIADIGTFPWLRSCKSLGIAQEEFPHLEAWLEKIEQRPAVQRGMQVMADLRRPQAAAKTC